MPTVVNAPAQSSVKNNIWANGGVLSLLGRALIEPMLQRDAQARRYEYDKRLAADAAAYEAEKIRLANAREDDLNARLINAFKMNTNTVPGTGEVITYLLSKGVKGDLGQVAPYYLPQQTAIDQGDKKTMAPYYPNGTMGSGTEYKVGMSPKDQGALSMAKEELALKKWIEAQGNALGWARLKAANANANKPSYRLLPDYVDANGNPVIIDKSGNTRSLAGIKKTAGGLDLDPSVRKEILKLDTKGINIDEETARLRKTAQKNLLQKYGLVAGDSNPPIVGTCTKEQVRRFAKENNYSDKQAEEIVRRQGFDIQ